jgi:hypothetical protein
MSSVSPAISVHSVALNRVRTQDSRVGEVSSALNLSSVAGIVGLLA